MKIKIFIIAFHTLEYKSNMTYVRNLIDRVSNKNHELDFYHIALNENYSHYLFINNEKILHLKSKNYIECYSIFVDEVAKHEKNFNIILFWGHSWGSCLGHISKTNPLKNDIFMSCHQFMKPILKNKIQTYLMWLESCYSGNIITVFDLYKCCKYLVSPSTYHDTPSIIGTFGTLDKIVNNQQIIDLIELYYTKFKPAKYHKMMIFKSKNIPKLIDYFTEVDLETDFNWGPTCLTKGDLNTYDLFCLSNDSKFHKILKTVIIYGHENSFIIDKKIFDHLQKEGKENTYYKILNKKSKKFYAEIPYIFNFRKWK